MDALLKPDDEMLFTLATELGLMSIISVQEASETSQPKPDARQVSPPVNKGALLT